MDEAFSKLSGDGVEDCLELARNFNLQLLMAFPIDRLGVMAPYADTVIELRKEEVRDDAGFIIQLDNIPVLLSPEQVQEHVGMIADAKRWRSCAWLRELAQQWHAARGYAEPTDFQRPFSRDWEELLESVRSFVGRGAERGPTRRSQCLNLLALLNLGPSDTDHIKSSAS
jgi:hypothetical protein